MIISSGLTPLSPPLSVPWHDDKTLRKDPHPTTAEFNVDVCNYLADNPASFRKFLESFLCFVGISRDEFLTSGRIVSLAGANDQEDVNVQGAGDDDVNEGDGDAAKANQTEQAIIADKPKRIRKKRKAADGAGGSGLPPKELREDHGISGIGASTYGKSVAALQSLLEGSTLPVEVAERFAISLDSSHDLTANATDDKVTSVIKDSASPSMAEAYIAGLSQPVGTELSAGSFYVSQDMDPETLRQVYIPKWNVTPPNEAWTETRVQWCDVIIYITQDTKNDL
ncbi:hypothetical protein Tco_0482009 [Tanacetum coccineum]